MHSAFVRFGIQIVCKMAYALRYQPHPGRKARHGDRRRHPRRLLEAWRAPRRGGAGRPARRVADTGARGAAPARHERPHRHAAAQGCGGLQGDARPGREPVRGDGRDGGDLRAARGHQHDAGRAPPPAGAPRIDDGARQGGRNRRLFRRQRRLPFGDLCRLAQRAARRIRAQPAPPGRPLPPCPVPGRRPPAALQPGTRRRRARDPVRRSAHRGRPSARSCLATPPARTPPCCTTSAWSKTRSRLLRQRTRHSFSSRFCPARTV